MTQLNETFGNASKNGNSSIKIFNDSLKTSSKFSTFSQLNIFAIYLCLIENTPLTASKPQNDSVVQIDKISTKSKHVIFYNDNRNLSTHSKCHSSPSNIYRLYSHTTSRKGVEMTTSRSRLPFLLPPPRGYHEQTIYLHNNTGFSTDNFNGFSDHITRINNSAYT